MTDERSPAPHPAPRSTGDRGLLRRAIWLSFWVGLLMLAIKVGAWWLTGSSAILGDAAESIVHVAAVAFVVYSLHLSQKPPDADHPYGHAKISFFSAGFEGGLIFLAGCLILVESIRQWVSGAEPDHLGPGIGLTVLALALNGALGWYLLRLGRRSGSLILVSNGRHVLADAWTSIGVIVGLSLAWATGWPGFDPLCAIAVALNLLRSGFDLVYKSAEGLMDRADPAVQETLVRCLDEAAAEHGVSWHQVRHRALGDGQWVDFHLVFEDDTSVKHAHEIATAVEAGIREALGGTSIVTSHLEPAEDHHRIHGHGPGEPEPGEREEKARGSGGGTSGT